MQTAVVENHRPAIPVARLRICMRQAQHRECKKVNLKHIESQQVLLPSIIQCGDASYEANDIQYDLMPNEDEISDEDVALRIPAVHGTAPQANQEFEPSSIIAVDTPISLDLSVSIMEGRLHYDIAISDTPVISLLEVDATQSPLPDTNDRGLINSEQIPLSDTHDGDLWDPSRTPLPNIGDNDLWDPKRFPSPITCRGQVV